MRVVPALDELEHRYSRLGWGLKAAARQRFAFQGRKEALARRDIETVTDRAPRRDTPASRQRAANWIEVYCAP